MILRSGFMRTLIRAACKAIVTVLLLIGCFFFACTSIQLQDEASSVVEAHDVLPVENPCVSGSAYRSSSSPITENNAGVHDFERSSPPATRRMGWAGRRLAESKLQGEDQQRSDKSVAMAQLHHHSRPAGHKHWALKRGIMSGLVSKNNHRPFSGASSMHNNEEFSKSEWSTLVAKKINVVDLHKPREKYDTPTLNADYRSQTPSISALHESKLAATSSKDPTDIELELQEPEKAVKRSLKSFKQAQVSKQPSSSMHIPAPPSSTRHASVMKPSSSEANISSPHESQSFSVSPSSPYGSDEADLSDIIGMDYGRARRKPPIHNKASP
eukprot:Gb_12568 [translate_table: standard]